MLPCSGMSVFKTLRGIQQLDLTDTMVADPGMQHITRLKDLKNLSLAYSSEAKSLQDPNQADPCGVLYWPWPCLLQACPCLLAWQPGGSHCSLPSTSMDLGPTSAFS